MMLRLRRLHRLVERVKDIEVLLLAPPYKGMLREPVGLFYLASVLMRNNISVSILDLNLDRMGKREFHDYIKKASPKIIGITSYTFNFYIALDILNEIKKNHPEIITVLGGVHASAIPEDILLKESSIDYIVIGEGEITFLELCQKILLNESCDNIEGLAYLEDKVRINPSRKPMKDLDSLGIPNRDLTNYFKYPVVSVQTSRGCPYNCIFCNICNYYEKTIRFRNPYTVVDECEALVKKHNYKNLYFFGDTFTFNKEWVETFCDELIKRDIKFHWSCETRVDNVDRQILEKMKEAGCMMIQYGIDYGDDEVLKNLGKDFTIETIEEAVDLTKRSNIRAEAFFIFNCPGENQETIDNTYNLIQRLPLDAVEINLLTPYPGTKIGDDPESFNMRIINKEFWNYTTKKYLLENESFAREKFIPAFRDLLKRLNLVSFGRRPEIFDFLEKEKKIKTWSDG
jgi:anaerobic magnesium-protoporphyrin IX monomethyl ester cyclase